MDAFTDRLSEYLDEELTPQQRAQVEAHLGGCDECRRTLEELRDVVARAGSLPPRPPAADLWEGVASRLAAPSTRVVAFDRFRGGHEPAPPRRISLTLPQLAAAAALLIVTSAGLSWMIRSRSAAPAAPIATAATTSAHAPEDGAPVIRVANFADAQYDQAVGDLQRALEEGRGRLDPKTIQVLEKNLAVIDEAIDQARKALAGDPANTYLNSYLADARRRKLDLLRDATAALANLPG
jgi:anti-sigma factor RsiW